MDLYHGSEKKIIKPTLFLGKKNNDYGQGFYMTENVSLAGEWACKLNRNGYINHYWLDIDKLNVLDLTDKKYNILHLITILLQNRKFDVNSDVAQNGKKYLLSKYKIEYQKYDVIKGLRADDSYFSFANDFLNNTITIEKLSNAFNLGNLGIQYVLKSEKAFNILKYIGADVAKAEDFFGSFDKRDTEARMQYRQYKENIDSGRYLSDVIREER